MGWDGMGQDSQQRYHPRTLPRASPRLQEAPAGALLTLQVVVVGVLGHPAVQEGPGQVVHGVLLVLDGLGDDLSVEVVVHAVVQVRLHRQRLVQELLEEILQGRKRGRNQEFIPKMLWECPVQHSGRGWIVPMVIPTLSESLDSFPSLCHESHSIPAH